MNIKLLRLGLVVLLTTCVSLSSFSQSNFNGPVYELKVNGLEEAADIKILVNSVRSSPEVDLCRYAEYKEILVIQTKEDMTYADIDALISETGFHLLGDVLTSKGVRMHSNGEITQPAQNE